MPLETFLEKQNLVLVEQISKGWTSYIYLVKNSKNKKFVAKVLREKSNRKQMVRREAENLRLANSVNIGPKLVSFDEKDSVVLMEFVEGITFDKWFFETNVSQKNLFSFLKELFSQAKKLDEIGLDHGQLMGRGRNIIVKNNKPVIIDFEKASYLRKPKNVSKLMGFFFFNPRSSAAKKVKNILKEKISYFLN
ncbi:MAG TPA: RIO1 family regulatory kinase/ATPase [archaeon]|nr:RIO1 family regulatory kinase/ATPase [archaeon]